MTGQAIASASGRLYFLDWVRIIAFFLLIFYHVGMYYVSWDWHVKSPYASHTIEPLMLLLSPWRLGLLFLVSGVASACMLSKSPGGSVLGRRSVRLLLPLIFGMFVIVPPQAYLEVVEKGGYAGSYLDFMNLYVHAYKGFCRGDDCLILPTWNHLWFVAYLWFYTVVLWCLMNTRFRIFARFAAAVDWLLRGWRIVVLPILMLAIAAGLLESSFPRTHALFDDWYNHARYGALFLLGAALARNTRFWNEVTALRWASLGLAAAAWGGILLIVSGKVPPAWATPASLSWMIFCWCAILAACGFASVHLNRDSAARRYLTEAAFPLYSFHQTIIVVLAHALQPMKLAPGIEAPLLIACTVAGSFGLFEAVRRVAWLRPLVGLEGGPRKNAEGVRAIPGASSGNAN